jgi:hypothetical protein
MEVRGHLEDISVSENIILKSILGKYYVDLIHVVQDIDQWWDLVNTVIKC